MEEVYYCKNCLSLRIITMDIGYDFCDECGMTDIGVTTIDKWEKMYEERYGYKFLNKRKDGRREKIDL